MMPQQCFEDIYLNSPKPLLHWQEECWEVWNQKGIPNRTNESWRYSSAKLKKMHQLKWLGNAASSSESTFQAPSFEHSLIHIEAGKIVKIDIHPEDQNHLSLHKKLPDSAWVTNMASEWKSDPFFSFGLANVIEPLMIEVAENTELKHPIFIQYGNDNQHNLCSSLVAIHLAANAKAKIFENAQDYSLNKRAARMGFVFANLEPHAHLEHFSLQTTGNESYQFSSLSATQDTGSRLDSGQFSFGGALQRSSLNIKQTGEHCESSGYGLFVGHKTQQVEQNTEILHDGLSGKSWQRYRGIINEQATGVFLGGVNLTPQGQKTNAHQLNKNILLADGAKVYTKPQLKIDADDVKCSHGATISKLREDELFYLTSRGIQPDDALTLLSDAFGGEIIAYAPNYFQATLKDLLKKYVRQENKHG